MDDAESKAELVYRYVSAQRWILGREMPDRDAWDWLKLKIIKGEALLFLGSICVDPADPRVITADEGSEQDHKFFEAMIEGHDGAVDMDTGLLHQWRDHILKGCPPPSRPSYSASKILPKGH